ncbi:MAG: galactose-1-phosphate uridylyltransferase [Nitrospirota bacterium]
MPQLRKDPIIGRWVIISTERGRRPSDFKHAVNERKGGFCPFCAGNENTTPPEVLSYREPGSKPNTPGWSLRVVPNKFPALQIEGSLDKVGEGLYDTMNGLGAHEVIIEGPSHDLNIAGLPLKNVEDTLHAYRERIVDLKKDVRFRYILIFKNEGEAAGASLEHSHSQLIALPIVPIQVSRELEGSKRYYRYRDRCVYCDIIRQELETGSRIVLENEHFICSSPFAPRFPFETWIIPKKHDSCYDHLQTHEIESLAKILKNILMRIDKALNIPPYNYIIHTGPIRENVNEYYHWHIEIMPKLTKVAGFEWGTGFYINPTVPEEAAKSLREAKID